MKKRETKSPIKNLPLRMPGQSIREAVENLLDEKVLPWIMATVFAISFAMVEWIRWVMDAKPSPWLYTIIAIVVVLITVRKCRKVIQLGKSLRLGRIGEEAVGQYLEEKLRPMGNHVFHDIPADGFNLDHVVVGPKGIYCIETKTRSKPAKGVSKVIFDGDKVTVDGLEPERDPVVQVKAAANWLAETLEQSTGRKIFVHPVILFPGWYVEQKTQQTSVWVLNEKALPTFMNNARNRPLSPEDVSLITFHLKRYVISANNRS